MAWRSNIPQKSFLCERLSIPSLEWFVFYMQMAISTTGRRPLCIFCSVSVLSKMLKVRSAEGSSFRLWWLLSIFCCWSSLLDAVSCCWGSILVLVIRLIYLLGSVRLGLDQDLYNNVECSEVRLFRWWACSGSNRLLLCWLWSIRCCFWGGPLSILAQWSESLKSLSEGWCLSSATRLRRLMPWCCWALWVFINPFNIAYR